MSDYNQLDKAALDRYITRVPEDSGLEAWQEKVIDFYPEEFWNVNQDFLTDNEISWAWHEKLYDKEYSPQLAACIIKRAFNRFIKEA